MVERIVVIGAGQAGASLVAKLRATGYGGALTLIGDEAVPPYQRPPLSKKYLMGEMGVERLYLRPAQFYADQGIRLVTGRTVSGIDRAERRVHAGGEEIGYDLLALTTGATPRPLAMAQGGGLAGVYVVRNLKDINDMVPEVVAGRRVLVVGGGYIGLEAAAVAAQRGLGVTVIEMAPRILNRVASAETSDAVRALHLAHGVEIREGIGLTRLVGEAGRVTGAVLSDGSEIAADFVLVGIGVTPNTALAEAAGLTIANGIAVDGRGATSDPAIYAAGDCASFPYRGARIRLESVQNAIDQAEHVALSMLGGQEDYAPLPWFWSDQYDAKLQIAGLNTGYTRVITRPGHREGGRSIWYYAGDRLVAVDAINDPKAYMIGKRWLEQGVNPAADRLADAAVPLAG